MIALLIPSTRLRASLDSCSRPTDSHGRGAWAKEGPVSTGSILLLRLRGRSRPPAPVKAPSTGLRSPPAGGPGTGRVQVLHRDEPATAIHVSARTRRDGGWSRARPRRPSGILRARVAHRRGGAAESLWPTEVLAFTCLRPVLERRTKPGPVWTQGRAPRADRTGGIIGLGLPAAAVGDEELQEQSVFRIPGYVHVRCLSGRLLVNKPESSGHRTRSLAGVEKCTVGETSADEWSHGLRRPGAARSAEASRTVGAGLLSIIGRGPSTSLDGIMGRMLRL